MTRLLLAGAGEAAGLAAFLGRLVRWDKAAVVRLRSAEGVLAVFGQPPFGGVLAIRTASLRDVLDLDATVSAGQLLEGIEERIEAGAGEAPDGSGDAVVVPPSVTGPAWAGLLPPRGGWQRVAEFAPEDVRAAAERLVGEFRSRTEVLVPERRTRAELDALAEEVWSRPVGDTALPMRAVHAAQALGFLRGGRDEPFTLLTAGAWLRLRTPYGSIAVRRTALGSGLTVTPA
ncbi:hypothetical protein G3I60_28935 [Streptomyces sp. SID13666]|uniref:hypothetical protein n=1 Tax=Streptomyces TaxID=1883 RepID=UPI0011070826|nr:MULTISPECIES: hypothetical protein [Streptomyces]MCZ4102033.1 hypothetical protein [Streptomyces sp. H39-C1]NEA58075.1 hypothetical protein [Streptomyces sp. SID13666]NEA74079.1 hypothetical protein [Streptomyces sp. SID13588]QNA73492.1 hypothetical protein C8250_017590 [Streptomyces sp. So13.3]